MWSWAPQGMTQPLPVGAGTATDTQEPQVQGAQSTLEAPVFRRISLVPVCGRQAMANPLAEPSRELLEGAQVTATLVIHGVTFAVTPEEGSVLSQQPPSQPQLSLCISLPSLSMKSCCLQRWGLRTPQEMSTGLSQRCHLGFLRHPPLPRAARSWKVKSLAFPAQPGPHPWGWELLPAGSLSC